MAQSTNRFVYDGWNLIAIVNPPSSILTSFTWGNDLSGTMDDAGGIGGLLLVTSHGGTATNCFVAYDGNGNVTALVKGGSDPIAARYEYSAYGETLRATGPLVKVNPFRFSTKFADGESGLLNYGYRYYSPGLGRFVNRDPIEEEGGQNLYAIALNNLVNDYDLLGMAAPGTLIDQEGTSATQSSLGSNIGRTLARQYNKIKDAIETYNDVQQFMSDAMDVLDLLDGGSGEMLAEMMQMGNSSLSGSLKKNSKTTYLYDKLGPDGEHLKYGITKNLDTRYSARELGGGRLKVLAKGHRKAMLALERALHTCPPNHPILHPPAAKAHPP